MPGYMESTNDVLVPLGCDLFVWCSVHEACGIIDRRLQGPPERGFVPRMGAS